MSDKPNKTPLGFKVFSMLLACVNCGGLIAFIVYNALQSPLQPGWLAAWAGLLPLAIVGAVLNTIAVVQHKHSQEPPHAP